MTGRTLFSVMAFLTVVFGAGLYYALNYMHYDFSEEERFALNIGQDMPPLMLTNVQYIDGATTALKMRICADPIELDEFELAAVATPLVAPSWFDCFDAGALQTAIDDGTAQAHIISRNEPYGFDLLAMNTNAKLYIWRQLNECGEARFSGDQMPAQCPEIPK